MDGVRQHAVDPYRREQEGGRCEQGEKQDVEPRSRGRAGNDFVKLRQRRHRKLRIEPPDFPPHCGGQASRRAGGPHHGAEEADGRLLEAAIEKGLRSLGEPGIADVPNDADDLPLKSCTAGPRAEADSFPQGVAVGQNFRAADRVARMTGGLPARSEGLKARPAITGMDMTRK
jgi:hypothetical protein